MGYTRSSASAWDGYTRSASTKSFGDKYTNKATDAGSKLLDEFNPAMISVRESRDSDANPDSTPIIVALDGTGSMNPVLDSAITNMGTLFKELYDRRPVSDPHIMAMIHQDVEAGDYGPLQATQFESDIVITDQLAKLYLRPQGGGNNAESYHLPLYFAATRTDCDAFKKGRKGYLFTIGDECVPNPLTPQQIKSVFGPDESVAGDQSYEQLLAQVSAQYHVFHLMVEQGSFMRHAADQVRNSWLNVLGQRAISLDNIDHLAEVIVATIQVTEGADAKKVADSFSDSKALTVRKAVSSLVAGDGAAGGVAAL